jgi:hypothetical protein
MPLDFALFPHDVASTGRTTFSALSSKFPFFFPAELF